MREREINKLCQERKLLLMENIQVKGLQIVSREEVSADEKVKPALRRVEEQRRKLM